MVRGENKRRRKEKEEAKILAEHIPGHIGDKDVDYLADFITGENSSNQKNKSSTVTNLNSKNAKENGVKKKEKDKGDSNNGVKKRHTNSDRSSPISNSNDTNIVNTHNDDDLRSLEEKDGYSFAHDQILSDVRTSNSSSTSQSATSRTSDHRISYGGAVVSPPASPHQAPSASSFAGFYLTDDENEVKGYLSDQTDQDTGFQVARTKRHKMRVKREKQALADMQVRRSLPIHKQHQPAATAPPPQPAPPPAPPAPQAPQAPPATAAPRAPVKKFNSIPESSGRSEKSTAAAKTTVSAGSSFDSAVLSYNSNIAEMPPVIMFDEETKCAEAATTPSTFTFGFFDDMPAAALADAPSKSEEVTNTVSTSTVPPDSTVKQPPSVSKAVSAAAGATTSIIAPRWITRATNGRFSLQNVAVAAANANASAPNTSHCETSETSLGNSAKLVPNTPAAPAKAPAIPAIVRCRFDVDVETFNYYEILMFIRKGE